LAAIAFLKGGFQGPWEFCTGIPCDRWKPSYETDRRFLSLFGMPMFSMPLHDAESMTNRRHEFTSL
jgi:hypothetical protein